MRGFFMSLVIAAVACAKPAPTPPADPGTASANTPAATPSECQAARCHVKGDCDALLEAVIWNGRACVKFEESGCSITCTSQHRSMSECEAAHSSCSK